MRTSLLAIVVFALDRWSKYLVDTRVGPYETRTVIPGFFDIVRSQNPGVAFGMFSESPDASRTLLLVLFSVVALAALAWMMWRNRHADAANRVAIALIFGGAAGNVFDRVKYGMVTDFLDFHVRNYHWYVFNVADTAITVGAGLMLLGMYRGSARQRAHG